MKWSFMLSGIATFIRRLMARCALFVMNELEAVRAPLTAKVLLGKLTLSGQPFDKGQNPYQSFALLTKLRSEIVHQKAYEELKWDGDGNPFVKNRNILESFQARSAWLRRKQSRSTARCSAD
jgi:hypothetical protein